jgi:glycosyltransferase involved in cell wall biosynthesis
VLEALACGTPVITTSAPANYAQYLIDEAAGGGVVCDPTAPALAYAIRDTLERTGIDAGYDTSWLRRYSWATTADSVADALS